MDTQTRKLLSTTKKNYIAKFEDKTDDEFMQYLKDYTNEHHNGKVGDYIQYLKRKSPFNNEFYSYLFNRYIMIIRAEKIKQLLEN